MFLLTYEGFHVTREVYRECTGHLISHFLDSLYVSLSSESMLTKELLDYISLLQLSYKEEAVFSKEQCKVSSSSNRLSEVNRTSWIWLPPSISCRGKQHYLSHNQDFWILIENLDVGMWAWTSVTGISLWAVISSFSWIPSSNLAVILRWCVNTREATPK